MSHEHPFAQYVRVLGKGPNLSRPLTLDETRAAVSMILKGEVEPVQLGAFLCLMRVKTETPDEVAGFALAVRDGLDMPADFPRPDIDWPSYAGKSRQLPLFILSALLLARHGLKVAMHGTEGHTAGRLYTRETLAALGIPAAVSLAEAGRQLNQDNFTYVPLEVLNPRLLEIFELKPLLGLRSPLHTVARNLNPFDAKAALMSVFHPNYRGVHRDASLLMGLSTIACFKGDGGEIERRPEKPCVVEGLQNGQPFEEEWPPLVDSSPGAESSLEPNRLAALWRGETSDAHAEMVVVSTAAIALRLSAKAASPAEAVALAQSWWDNRPKQGIAG
ncbi:MAG TPA: glycosyl transferase family protein [Candidatus Sulfotelmatobacter sp.]|jgi:anthranilate phosphoribosyltransferase|nr:glycosyl transferase family protein [Candidatus Sulfotelmatobacter sp.]